MEKKEQQSTRYVKLITRVFLDKYTPGARTVEFTRDELVDTARSLDIRLPKNLGDVMYTFRYRMDLPAEIKEKAPDGWTWIIVGTGHGKYCFQLSNTPNIEPNSQLMKIRIPDNTPEIIERYSINDEQGVLSKVRYNRLIDIFLGITTFSLQNHLRTTVEGIGQIEIDELYVGVDKDGRHFVIPVQAKGPRDKIGVVQLKQDIAFCEADQKFRNSICIPIAVQFLSNDVICMFHLNCEGYNAYIVDEKHYELVPSSQLTDEYVGMLKNRPR